MFHVVKEEGVRPGNPFYHTGDGYQYYKCAETVKGTTYFNCVQFRSGCRGRASLDARGFQQISAHCHKEDFHYPELIIAKQKLLARCKTFPLTYLAFKSIIDYEMAGAHPEVKARLNAHQLWTILKTSIRREANAQLV